MKRSLLETKFEKIDEDGKFLIPGVLEPIGRHNLRFVRIVHWLRRHEARLSCAAKAVKVYKNGASVCYQKQWHDLMEILRQGGFYADSANLRDSRALVIDAAFAATCRRPPHGWWKTRPQIA